MHGGEGGAQYYARAPRYMPFGPVLSRAMRWKVEGEDKETWWALLSDVYFVGQIAAKTAHRRV